VFKSIELYITNTTIWDSRIFADIKMNCSHLTPTINRRNNKLEVCDKISGSRFDLDKSVLTETDYEPEVTKIIVINNRLHCTWKRVKNVNESVIASLLHFNRTDSVRYEWFNIEARSWNHCCKRKAINVTYSECLLVALDIKRAIFMRRIVIFGLSGCTVFFYL
jgi:hypothetical protein